MLTTVAGDGLLLAGGDGAAAEALGPPLAPADRRLRETAAAKCLWQSALGFTPDAQAVVFAGMEDTDLAFWSLSTGERTVTVTRSRGIAASALLPDGQWLCIAAMDGLAMYSYPLPCELKWEAQSGTHFCAVAFSGDSSMVASVRGGDTGLVEVRNAETNNLLKAIDDFLACHSHMGGLPGGLGFSRELLAIGGKNGKSNAKQVRLYSVASDFETVATLELPGTKEDRDFFVLAFNPAGDRLAVAIDRLVAVFSGENDLQDLPLQLGAAVAGDDKAISVCFRTTGASCARATLTRAASRSGTSTWRRACASSSARALSDARAPSARRTTCW